MREHFGKVETQARIYYANNLDELAPTLENVITEIRSTRASELLTGFDNLPALNLKLAELMASKMGLAKRDDAEDKERLVWLSKFIKP